MTSPFIILQKAMILATKRTQQRRKRFGIEFWLAKNGSIGSAGGTTEDYGCTSSGVS